MSTHNPQTGRSTASPHLTCPHCGEKVDSLAQHIGNGRCRAAADVDRGGRVDRSYNGTHVDADDLPLLEEAPERVAFDEEDLRRRRRLAERLAHVEGL